MKMHSGVQLSDVEYEELLTLAEAADNGEDVMLTAFMRLCPTGQEGAFDESVVAAYAALADLGFIEGVQEGGEFFFEDITPAGRSLTNPSFARNRDDKSALFGEAASFDESAAFDEPIDVAAEDAQSDEASGSEVAALFESPATKQAVIAGAVAGFVAGAIAAAIVCFVL